MVYFVQQFVMFELKMIELLIHPLEDLFGGCQNMLGQIPDIRLMIKNYSAVVER
jgi:hypothetical protein